MSPRLRFPMLIATLVSVSIGSVVLLFMAVAAASQLSPAAGQPRASPSAGTLPLNAQVVINEVMPLALAAEHTWIELFVNTTSVFLPLVSSSDSSSTEQTMSTSSEAAVVVNRLAGWQISDGDGNVYTIPDLSLIHI